MTDLQAHARAFAALSDAYRDAAETARKVGAEIGGGGVQAGMELAIMLTYHSISHANAARVLISQIPTIEEPS